MSSTTPAPATQAEPDLSGRLVGDYQVLRRLGRGGMAVVYLAEQRSLGRQVALKVLRRELAGDQSYIKRFQNEARAAAALVHANIVQIHEVGCIDQTYFIAQEYVPGQNLKQALARRAAPLEPPTALRIVRQVAAALHKARERGIVHRDIKPENIMLTADGQVKVADFGLARAPAGADLGLTQENVTVGTPLYMSPEQAEGRTLDHRSDLYSLGVTTYEMLAGRPPFQGDTALAVAIQHVNNEPARLETLRPDLPTGLARIVHRLLAKSPDERYQQAADLLRDLRALNVPGDDHDWPADLQEWAADTVAIADGRHEATRQLAKIMKSAPSTSPRGRAWGFALAAIVAAAALGALVAWRQKPDSLLDAAEETLAAPKMADVAEQYWYAQMTNTHPAWESVSEHFPASESAENERYSWLAKQHQAWLYYRENDFENALKLFIELSSLPETEVDLIDFGLAGQALIYASQSKVDLFAPILSQFQRSPERRERLRRMHPEIHTELEELMATVPRMDEAT
jgi:serine/threonine-protein kinase